MDIEEISSFDELKSNIAPILSLPDFTKGFIIKTDGKFI